MLSYLNFFTGVALLLLGVRSMRRGTERLLGARLRKFLQSATRNRWRSLLTGLLVSIITPSTTAVTLLSVEAINAGYMTFPHVLALMLGANIGFTITVQFLAFKFYIYNAVFIVPGVLLYLFGKRVNIRGVGEALLGIGLLLLALQILSAGAAGWKQSAGVDELMRALANHPVVLVGFETVLGLVLQSPTAVIGIAMALCAQGVLPINGGLAVVLGANLGVGVTGLIAGFAKADTRRMAVGNLLFKLIGVAVCVPLIPVLVFGLHVLSPAGEAQVIANAHTLFNVALALVFLPLVPFVAGVLERLIQAREPSDEMFGPRYLDPAALASPGLALAQATRETLRVADCVKGMFQKAHQAFQEDNLALCEDAQKDDDKVDLLNNEIKTYLSRISEQSLTHEESQREMALLAFSIELESMGDIIDKNLVDAAKKKMSLKVKFSPEGWQELDRFFGRVLENFDLAVEAFAKQDRALAEKLLRHKRTINEQEIELRGRHFRRLRDGLEESFETSSIHLDVLTYLRAINSHLTSVAYPILETRAS